MGGIIADVMGLGKTLTMISAVVASLARATEHATAKDQDSVHPSSGCQSRATLVVVTSMRSSSPLYSNDAAMMLTLCRGSRYLGEGDIDVRVSCPTPRPTGCLQIFAVTPSLAS